MMSEKTRKFMDDICDNNYMDAKDSLTDVVTDKIDSMCANTAKDWLDGRNKSEDDTEE